MGSEFGQLNLVVVGQTPVETDCSLSFFYAQDKIVVPNSLKVHRTATEELLAAVLYLVMKLSRQKLIHCHCVFNCSSCNSSSR